MSAIITAPENAKCLSCDEEVSGIVLRCGTTAGGGKSGCGKFTHLGCSQLPSSYLVRLDLTRASYLCTSCIVTETGERYSESLALYQTLCVK